MRTYSVLSNMVLLGMLSGCAAGSATAGYAIKAHTADQLSSDGEARIVERAKRELIAEYCLERPCMQPLVQDTCLPTDSHPS
jgi:hypothetical protein